MSKFNVGDKVRVVKFNSFAVPAWIGTTGTVCIVNDNSKPWNYYVDLDIGESEKGFDEDELELVKE